MNQVALSQKIARVGLGAFLTFAGISHLTFGRKDFQAQVPDWVPLNKDLTVLLSGGAEITLGLSLMLLPQHKKETGELAAAFFTAVFPGNVSQYTHHRSAFGLDTDKRRFARLFFQPALIAWALWGSGMINKNRKFIK